MYTQVPPHIWETYSGVDDVFVSLKHVQLLGSSPGRPVETRGPGGILEEKHWDFEGSYFQRWVFDGFLMGFWWFFDGFWLVFDGFWWFLMVFWWFLIGFWWFLTVFDVFWCFLKWFLMVFVMVLRWSRCLWVDRQMFSDDFWWFSLWNASSFLRDCSGWGPLSSSFDCQNQWFTAFTLTIFP